MDTTTTQQDFAEAQSIIDNTPAACLVGVLAQQIATARALRNEVSSARSLVALMEQLNRAR